ncbi:MAG TPA: efflux RND transporter periplasmic adaptor subunit [Steroidobacteraceae bacterium]|nr:efflux RND transporter periplasmic adaptor subunit [Steroidobacteraceae bacterium]
MKLASLTRLPGVDNPAMRGTSAQDQSIDPAAAQARRRRLIIIGSVAGALLVLLSAWLVYRWMDSAALVPRERVRVAEVTVGRFIRDVSAQGTIVAAVSPTLYAPSAGTVTVIAKPGSQVAMGELLATIDSPQLRNDFQRERATLDSLNTDLERERIEVKRKVLANKQAADLADVQIKAAQREFQRAQSSWDLKVISERDYQRAKDDLSAAELNYHHAVDNASLDEEGLGFEIKTRLLERDRQKFVVDNLTRRVSELDVKAPVAGIVGNVAVRQKAAVAENTPIITVVDLTAFEVEFQMPESYAGMVGAGMPAEINLGSVTVPGAVIAVSPEVNQGLVTGRVRFTQGNPPGLRQSQRVAVRVVMDQRDQVTKLERGSFADSVAADGSAFAYVLTGDRATRRQVMVGAVSIGEVEVLSGLKAGEQVVVSGLDDVNRAPVVRLTD